MCTHVGLYQGLQVPKWGGDGQSVRAPGAGVASGHESPSMDTRNSGPLKEQYMLLNTEVSPQALFSAIYSIVPIFTRPVFFDNKMKKGILPLFLEIMGKDFTFGRRRGREGPLSIHQEVSAE